MSEILDAVVVGAGTAGLGASYFLKQRGLTHRVIERASIGEAWRTQRWDSFRLNSPIVRSLMPGDEYDGPDPWAALTHHEFVAYLEGYAERNGLPVTSATTAQELTREDGAYRLATTDGSLSAHKVVIATGNQNCPVRPAWSTDLPSRLRQIDSSEYRSPAVLGEGSVLVVGSGQSGGQIAEDLALAGRTVFLATSRTGRFVKRYRGGNMLNWLTLSGFQDTPRRELILPSGRPQARPLLGATHTISLQLLSAQGVVLLGRFVGVENGSLIFGNELADNIRFADEESARIKRFVDDYIAQTGLHAPPPGDDPAETVAPKLPEPPIRSIDIAASGLGTVIWCTGFTGDFRWVKIPGALDAAGQPIHEDGVGAVPGLYFAGLDFASTRKSGTVPAIVEETGRLIERLVATRVD